MDWIFTPINLYVDAVLWLLIAIASLLLAVETRTIRKHKVAYYGVRNLMFANIFWSVIKIFITLSSHTAIPLVYITEHGFMLLLLLMMYWISTHYMTWD